MAKHKQAEQVGTLERIKDSSALPVDDSEDCYIFNEDTGELRMVHTRAGYAPAPMPFGFRLAKNEEIPGK